MTKTAKELGLESSLRPRGRPKKSGSELTLFDDTCPDVVEEEK